MNHRGTEDTEKTNTEKAKREVRKRGRRREAFAIP
jgi:hypothetical protein